MQAIFSIFFLIFQSFNASAYKDLFSCIPVTSIFTFSFLPLSQNRYQTDPPPSEVLSSSLLLPLSQTSTSRILSSVSNTLWAFRVSFEIRHLRRLSRGSADPREHSRSWGLAQSCPAHVAAPWCCRPLPGSSPFATIFFSTYPHYPHIYPHPQFPSLWIPLCITLFT